MGRRRERRPKPARSQSLAGKDGGFCRRPTFQFQGQTPCGRASLNHRGVLARRFLEWISKETSHTLIRLVSEKETGKSRCPCARVPAAFSPNESCPTPFTR